MIQLKSRTLVERLWRSGHGQSPHRCGTVCAARPLQCAGRERPTAEKGGQTVQAFRPVRPPRHRLACIVHELYGKQTVVLAHQFNAIWYRVGGNDVLSIVLVRDPDGKYPDTVLFDTDINATDTEIITMFSSR